MPHPDARTPAARLDAAERHLAELEHQLDLYAAADEAGVDWRKREALFHGQAALAATVRPLLAELRQLRADVDSLRSE